MFLQITRMFLKIAEIGNFRLNVWIQFSQIKQEPVISRIKEKSILSASEGGR